MVGQQAATPIGRDDPSRARYMARPTRSFEAVGVRLYQVANAINNGRLPGEDPAVLVQQMKQMPAMHGDVSNLKEVLHLSSYRIVNGRQRRGETVDTDFSTDNRALRVYDFASRAGARFVTVRIEQRRRRDHGPRVIAEITRAAHRAANDDLTVYARLILKS